MTVNIGELQTEIEGHDNLPLQTMAESVLANRPSFRTLRGRVGDEPVEIYTRCDRSGGEEVLIVESVNRRVVFRPSDREALASIVHRTA